MYSLFYVSNYLWTCMYIVFIVLTQSYKNAGTQRIPWMLWGDIATWWTARVLWRLTAADTWMNYYYYYCLEHIHFSYRRGCWTPLYLFISVYDKNLPQTFCFTQDRWTNQLLITQEQTTDRNTRADPYCVLFTITLYLNLASYSQMTESNAVTYIYIK